MRKSSLRRDRRISKKNWGSSAQAYFPHFLHNPFRASVLPQGSPCPLAHDQEMMDTDRRPESDLACDADGQLVKASPMKVTSQLVPASEVTRKMVGDSDTRLPERGRRRQGTTRWSCIGLCRLPAEECTEPSSENGRNCEHGTHHQSEGK